MSSQASRTLAGATAGGKPVLLGRMPAGAELRPVDSLVVYEKNPRTHSAGQVAQIAASIIEFGWTNPILVDADSKIIAGHGRLAAARKLKLAEVPVLVLGHLTPAQRRAYVIADNKIALNAGWDEELLAAELRLLEVDDFDLGLTGFDSNEIDSLYASVAKTERKAARDENATAEPEAAVISRPGDLWLLGPHRLMCGSSTEVADVGKLLAGKKPHLMVTDPPYGVEYDAAWRQRAGVGSAGAATGKVLNDDRADWREAWALFPGSVVYIWHAGTRAGDVAASLKAEKFNVRAQIVWVKSRHVLSRGDYHHQHEPCFYGVREGEDEQWHFVAEHEIATYAVEKNAKGRWSGDRKQSTVWTIEHLKSDTGHSTQKPVECMRRPIVNNSRRGDVVYEPFAGSGTTIIAAETVGRRCYAMELSPAYVDLIVRRWQDFTGKSATLQGDGRDFAAIEDERVPALAA